MSSVFWIRGSNNLLCKGAAALAMLIAAAPMLAAESAKPTAELGTYSRDGNQTYYALSLTPPGDAVQAEPRDVLIVFNTSASQTGAHRDTALAALEACIAKLNPQDRVQLLAADLEARPMTEKFEWRARWYNVANNTR